MKTQYLKFILVLVLWHSSYLKGTVEGEQFKIGE